MYKNYYIGYLRKNSGLEERRNSKLASTLSYLNKFKCCPYCWKIASTKNVALESEQQYGLNASGLGIYVCKWLTKKKISIYTEPKGSGSLQKLKLASSVKEINDWVLPHFDNYPLITQKLSDYLLFKKAIYLINSKKNMTKEEFLGKFVGIKASMNRGLLSDNLKSSFTNIVPVSRPIVNSQIPHPQWVAGFTSGEGCFMIKTSVNRNAKLGYGVQLSFQVTQNERDIELIRSLVSYLGCGRLVVNEKHNGSKVNFNVTKFSDIQELIIPFFLKHKILGVKFLDFEDWCRAGEIIKNKGHLSKEGLDEVFKLKAGINRGRSS